MSDSDRQPAQDNASTFERIAELLDFPADFPIKVMGNQHSGFVEAIGTLVCTYVPNFDVASMKQTNSRTGRFISLTVPVRVESREQLQSLYEALADHELVRIVL